MKIININLTKEQFEELSDKSYGDEVIWFFKDFKSTALYRDLCENYNDENMTFENKAFKYPNDMYIDDITNSSLVISHDKKQSVYKVFLCEPKYILYEPPYVILNELNDNYLFKYVSAEEINSKIRYMINKKITVLTSVNI